MLIVGQQTCKGTTVIKIPDCERHFEEDLYAHPSSWDFSCQPEFRWEVENRRRGEPCNMRRARHGSL